MKIRFKESVQLNPQELVDGCLGEIILGLVATAPPLIGDQLWITSANDSRHGNQSLHYADQALDVRFLGIRPGGIAVPVGTSEADAPTVQRRLAEEWRQRLAGQLGQRYDCVRESDHLHVEYDPR